MEVPRQMFPFVRQIIGDMTVNGGFPPLLMQLVDFADLYRQKFGVAGLNRVRRIRRRRPTRPCN